MIQVRFLHPKDNKLKSSGYDLAAQAKLYDAQLEDVLANTRWYLDNLDYLPVYTVSWHDYSMKSATLPYSLVRKQVKHGTQNNI